MTEVIPFDPSNRIKVVSQSDMVAPAQCAICTNVSCDLGFIDTDLHIEWVGAIYFCGYCAINVAQAMGCATPNQTRQLITENSKLKEDYLEALSHNSELEGALDALSLTRLSDRSAVIDGTNFSSIVSASATTSDVVPELKSEPEGRTDSESSEPVKVDGPDDLSNDADPNGINALIGL